MISWSFFNDFLELFERFLGAFWVMSWSFLTLNGFLDLVEWVLGAFWETSWKCYSYLVVHSLIYDKAPFASCRVYISSFDMNKLILIVFLFFIINYMFTPNVTSFLRMQNLSKYDRKLEKIRLNWINIPQIILFGFGLISLFWLLLLHSCNQVKYVSFNTNLNLFKKKSNHVFPQLWFYLILVLSWLLVSEYPEDFIQFYLQYFPNFAFLINLDPKISKHIARSCFHTSRVFIFADSISPGALILSIFVFQIWCNALSSNVPRWLPFILILMANDIELNPGPALQNQFFSFMNWNLNSLVKENFGRVGLIEAHNTIFDYDLISLWNQLKWFHRNSRPLS